MGQSVRPCQDDSDVDKDVSREGMGWRMGAERCDSMVLDEICDFESLQWVWSLDDSELWRSGRRITPRC